MRPSMRGEMYCPNPAGPRVLRGVRSEGRRVPAKACSPPGLRQAGLLPRRVLPGLLITVGTFHRDRNSRDGDAKQSGTIKEKT